MAVCAMPLVLSTAGSPLLLWTLIAIFGVAAYFLAERLNRVAIFAAASIVIALAAAPFAFARHDPAAQAQPVAGAPAITPRASSPRPTSTAHSDSAADSMNTMTTR